MVFLFDTVDRHSKSVAVGSFSIVISAFQLRIRIENLWIHRFPLLVSMTPWEMTASIGSLNLVSYWALNVPKMTQPANHPADLRWKPQAFVISRSSSSHFLRVLPQLKLQDVQQNGAVPGPDCLSSWRCCNNFRAFPCCLVLCSQSHELFQRDPDCYVFGGDIFAGLQPEYPYIVYSSIASSFFFQHV